MSHRKIEIIVGVVTLAALTILITVTANLKKSTIFSHKYPITAFFKDVKGLEIGAPVQVQGVISGDVRKIEPSGRIDYPVRVLLMIRSGTELHDGAQARILSAGLVGETEMSIEDTSPTAPAIQPGDIIFGQPSTSLDDLLQRAPTIIQDLQSSIAALSEMLTDPRNRRALTNILESASSITLRINSSLEASSSDFTAAVRNVRVATEQLKQLMTDANTTFSVLGRDLASAGSNFNALVGDLRTSAGRVMTRLDSAAAQIDKTTNRADQLLATAQDILAENRADARTAILRLTSATVHVDNILARVDEGQSTLADMVIGPRASATLANSLVKLDDSMAVLRRWLEGLDAWWTGAEPDRRRLTIPYDIPTTGAGRGKRPK